MSPWIIELRAQRWSQPLRSARAFESPEAAATYAHALVDEPDIWTDGEGWALCRLIEAEEPSDIEVLIFQLL